MAGRTGRGRAGHGHGVAALVLGVLVLLLIWPGIVVFDSVRQYEQALAGSYDDWHPPIMARLWGALLTLHIDGSGPLLLLQLVPYWIGIALIAAALARTGARGAGWAAIVAGLSPLLIDWMVVVVKDAQMVGAMVGATGIVVWYRLSGRRLAWPAVVVVALLLSYALLARANAVFAVVPLAFAFAGWRGLLKGPVVSAMLMLVATVAALAGQNFLNHRVFDAERTHVERTLPLFDLVGIARHLPPGPLAGVPEAEWRKAEACYTPFYWDPLGNSRRCGAVADTLVWVDGPSPVGRYWVAAIASHPFAYAEHRLAHLNAMLRVATPLDERNGAAPAMSEPNPYGLGLRSNGAAWVLGKVANAAERTPLGSPAVWLVLAAGLCWTLHGTARQPARDMGLGLALSACLMTASFAVVSIASDLRYHLWLMAATPLATVMLAACKDINRKRLRWTLCLTAAACAASVAARAVAPAMAY